jgi:hypothetical protein
VFPLVGPLSHACLAAGLERRGASERQPGHRCGDLGADHLPGRCNDGYEDEAA